MTVMQTSSAALLPLGTEASTAPIRSVFSAMVTSPWEAAFYRSEIWFVTARTPTAR